MSILGIAHGKGSPQSHLRESPCVGRLAATTGKSSRGAFGFVMRFRQQSAWPASGPSQRPRGPVDIHKHSGSRECFASFWSLVFGPGNAFLVPKVNDLAFGGLVI
jgi:hypothetical protein